MFCTYCLEWVTDEHLSTSIDWFCNCRARVAQILIDRGDWPEERALQVRFPIVAVSDPLKGSCYDSDGLHVPDLLTSVHKNDNANAVHCFADNVSNKIDGIDALVMATLRAVQNRDTGSLIIGEW